MNFTKMQGAGNDFILVETSDTQRNWSSLAVAMCDRHFGVGCDSLILVLPSSRADFQMRIFDADGTEAEACGNGLGCLAKYVFEKGLISTKANQISVETVAGIRKIKLDKRGGKLISIQASMGKPEFSANHIPVAIEQGRNKIVYIKSMLSYPVSVNGTDLLLNCLSMGNPHAVYFSPQPVSNFPLSRLGPKVERLAIFPNRVNFEVARVLSQQQIEVRVWERGVGETLACGSGACAVAVAAQLHGYTAKKVNIKLPGGILQVEWDGTGEVLLSGPAEKVFNGEWPD
ncbi:MAG: diaminopimelate epimerase [Dehalococcoidales bacterium]